MGTNIRPEISEKNLYWIDKHRYYELKHFCLQYPIWRKAYHSIDGYLERHFGETTSRTNKVSDPTYCVAEKRMYYSDRMRLIEKAAEDTDPFLARYILAAVTEGRSYTNLKTRLEIPCGKNTYYELYRRFFWLLSKSRN